VTEDVSGEHSEQTITESPDPPQSKGEGSRGRHITFKAPQITKYFLLLDLNGLLIASDESDKGWPKPLVVWDGVGAFLQFCLENFEVSFWSCCRIRRMGELLVVLQKHCPVTLEYCKLFDQSWCDIVTNANGTPVSTPRPYFLKTLATVLTNPDGLRDTGARPENTLIVDDSPHKNVRNNMWNVVHSTTFIGSHP
jgi:hypothetical protein